MQRAEDSSSRLLSESEPPRAGLRPSVVFAAIALALVAIAAAFLFTRPDTSPAPSTTQTNTEPNFALTNEEAITRFEELMTTLEQAYGEHDVTYLDSLYTSDSPLRGIARRELTRLANDGVRDLSAFETKELIVRTNSSSEVTLRQVVVVTPRFATDAGKDVTKSRRPTRQVVDWTLRLQDGNWLLEDALITEAKHIR